MVRDFDPMLNNLDYILFMREKIPVLCLKKKKKKASSSSADATATDSGRA